MAVIYLKHPIHGYKVACGEQEAAADRVNGWLDHDPATPEPQDEPEVKTKAAPKKAAEVAPKVESIIPSFLADISRAPKP